MGDRDEAWSPDLYAPVSSLSTTTTTFSSSVQQLDGKPSRRAGMGVEDGKNIILVEDDVEGQQNLDDYVESVMDPLMEQGRHNQPSQPGMGGGTNAEHQMTTFEAGLAFFKSNWGIGFLGTPFAFSKAGLAGGVIAFVVLLFVVVYTTRLLIKCKEELKQQGVRVSTLSDITRTILGVRMDFLVTALVAVAQVGDCALYVIFIGRSMEAIFAPNSIGGFYYSIAAACLFPILLPLVLVRKFKSLMWVVYLALAAMAFAVFAVMTYGFTHARKCVDPVTEFETSCEVTMFDMGSMPVFLGIVSFALEGVQNVMPIHEAMKRPGEFNKMLYMTYGILGVIYVIFGVGVYILFADTTQSVIAVNVKGDMGLAVKVMLSFMLVCTYPMQLFPVAHIIDHKLKWHNDDPRSRRNSSLARILLLASTIAIAVGIPYFGNMLSLIGCSAVTFLGYFLPSALYIKNFDKRVSSLDYFLCISCIFVCVVVMISGMVVNIEALANRPGQ